MLPHNAPGARFALLAQGRMPVAMSPLCFCQIVLSDGDALLPGEGARWHGGLTSLIW
jgi:hypothetical protein